MATPGLDIVFEGGGAKGIALNGAVAELERRGFVPGRLVGTSAGSIAATLIAAGYSGEQLRRTGLERLPSGASRMTTFLSTPSHFGEREILDSTIGEVLAAALDPILPKAVERPLELFAIRTMLRSEGFAHLFSFVERGGFYSADGFLEWLVEQLDADGRAFGPLTLAEFHERTRRELTLITSDTTAKRMLILNHRSAPDLPLRIAVRMSMSIPFLWPEVLWQPEWGRYLDEDVTGHAMMDGGLVSNFALRLLVSDDPWIEKIMGGPADPERYVLGLALDSTLPVYSEPAKPAAPHLQWKVLDRIERVFDTALEGNDVTEEDEYAAAVCDLPTGGYGTLEFDMSVERIDRLMDVAAAAVDRWLDDRAGMPHRVETLRALLATNVRRISEAPTSPPLLHPLSAE